MGTGMITKVALKTVEPRRAEQPYLSIIVPVNNEAENVTTLHGELGRVLNSLQIPCEIIFIDDGSKDGTYEILKDLRASDEKVIVLRFRKNYGKSAALSCGFSYARGEVIVTIDGDLQDDPAEIPRFLEYIDRYEVVSGWKQKRKDSIDKIVPSRIFNFAASKLTGVKIHDFNCGYKAYRREVVKNLNVYGEMHRYIPALAHWKGYSVGEIRVNHRPRVHGKSKYGFSRLFKGTLDLLTVKFLMSYYQRPLHLFGSLGALFTFIGGAIGAYLCFTWLTGAKIGDRPLLTLAVLMVIMGIQFVAIGMIGELIVNTKENKEWMLKED